MLDCLLPALHIPGLSCVWLLSDLPLNSCWYQELERISAIDRPLPRHFHSPSDGQKTPSVDGFTKDLPGAFQICSLVYFSPQNLTFAFFSHSCQSIVFGWQSLPLFVCFCILMIFIQIELHHSLLPPPSSTTQLPSDLPSSLYHASCSQHNIPFFVSPLCFIVIFLAHFLSV